MVFGNTIMIPKDLNAYLSEATIYAFYPKMGGIVITFKVLLETMKKTYTYTVLTTYKNVILNNFIFV